MWAENSGGADCKGRGQGKGQMRDGREGLVGARGVGARETGRVTQTRKYKALAVYTGTHPDIDGMLAYSAFHNKYPPSTLPQGVDLCCQAPHPGGAF